MSEHTPGPWTVKEYNDGDSRPTWNIVRDTGERATPWVAQAGNPANARLIAAAPELLAALERIAGDISISIVPGVAGSPPEILLAYVKDVARAAIAKAEGEL